MYYTALDCFNNAMKLQRCNLFFRLTSFDASVTNFAVNDYFGDDANGDDHFGDEADGDDR